MLVHTYLLLAAFPYAGFLAIYLAPLLDEENVGRCAGLIGAIFMVGCSRMFTSYAWGNAADRCGRTFILKASLLLSAAFTGALGFALTLSLALAARFALGLSNCLHTVVQTLLSELSHRDKAVETKGMTLVNGTWGLRLPT